MLDSINGRAHSPKEQVDFKCASLIEEIIISTIAKKSCGVLDVFIL